MADDDNSVILDERPLVRRTTTVVRLDNIRKLDWKHRIFRPMGHGSMRRLIIMWVAMCMGTGNLTLPYYFSSLGIIPAITLLLFTCFLNLKMCIFINEMAMASNSTNFYVLVERAVPKPFFMIFKYTIFIDILMTMMSGSVVVWNMFEYIMFSFGVGKAHYKEWITDFDHFEVNEYHPTIIIIRGVFYLTVYVILVRFFFKRSLGPLGVFLQLSMCSTLAVVLFTMIDVPFFRRGYKNEDLGIHLIKPISNDWFNGFFGFCFCYYIQPYMLSLRSELSLPTPYRVKKTMAYGFGAQALLYCLLGLSAYISLGDKYTPSIITTRKAYENRNPIWEGVFRLITISYFISNAMCLASYSPTLKVCMRAFLKIKSKNRRRFVLSTVPFTVSCLFSFLYPHITSIINICGATLYNYNGYIIPLLMKVKLLKESNGAKWKLALCYLMLTFFSASMVYALVLPLIGVYSP